MPKPYVDNLEESVADGLRHLWEYRRLGSHSLAELVVVEQFLPRDKFTITHLDRGQAVHQLLLAGMEELRRLQCAGDSREGHYFAVLDHEYVQRKKNTHAANDLGMSESMFYRTRREAVRCLAEVIADLEASARADHDNRQRRARNFQA